MAGESGAVGASGVHQTWLDRGENNLAPKDNNNDRQELLKKTDVFTLAAGGFKL